ncbi:MAG: hypothetical protein KAY37_17810 [Phycisphaerae bacterium]|nr:hypothetical protein [Phycisphaerae bacterium]
MTLAPSWRAEISRKVLHVSSALIPALYAFTEQEFMLWLLAAGVAIAVLVEIFRHTNSRFRAFFKLCVGFMVRRSEWSRISGATYVLVAALLSIWLFPMPIAIAVLFILSISDSAASLIGLRYGRNRFLGKSVAGSSAFFVTAFGILWIALPGSAGIAFAGALVATFAEALPAWRLERFELNDNLTIPLLTGVTVWLLQEGI